MKNIKFLVLLVLMTMSANGMFADIFVNMKSPYVHLVYDSGLNEKVWKSVDGTVLATEKEAKPLADIDKGVYHDPRIKNQYVKKVWDNERGCYIYRSTTGDFLGRELPSESLEKQWLDSKDSNDHGSVSWNLGKTTGDNKNYKLEAGWTYEVAFDVWPSQNAYDILAALNNGDLTYGDPNATWNGKAIDWTQFEGSAGNYSLLTNTTFKLVDFNVIFFAPLSLLPIFITWT